MKQKDSQDVLLYLCACMYTDTKEYTDVHLYDYLHRIDKCLYG